MRYTIESQRAVDHPRRQQIMIRAIGTHMFTFALVMREIESMQDNKYDEDEDTNDIVVQPMVLPMGPTLFIPHSLRLRRQNAITWVSFPPYKYHPNKEQFFEYYDF
jgi:hypothetical protein